MTPSPAPTLHARMFLCIPHFLWGQLSRVFSEWLARQKSPGVGHNGSTIALHAVQEVPPSIPHIPARQRPRTARRGAAVMRPSYPSISRHLPSSTIRCHVRGHVAYRVLEDVGTRVCVCVRRGECSLRGWRLPAEHRSRKAHSAHFAVFRG